MGLNTDSTQNTGIDNTNESEDKPIANMQIEGGRRK
jgi:hypothetical protein